MAINIDVRLKRLVPNTVPGATVLYVADTNGFVEGVKDIKSVKDLENLVAADETEKLEKQDLLNMLYLIQAGMIIKLVDKENLGLEELKDKDLNDYRFITTDDLTIAKDIVTNLLEKGVDAELYINSGLNAAGITTGLKEAKVNLIANTGEVGMATKLGAVDLKQTMETIGVPVALGVLVRKARVVQEGRAWIPIAGFNEGNLTEFIKLHTQIGNIQKDTLVSEGINVGMLKAGVGVVVYGQNTGLFMDEETNPLAKSNIVTLTIDIKRALWDLADKNLYLLNNAKTWKLLKMDANKIFKTILDQGGIEDYSVRVGLGETMTPEDVRKGKLILQASYTPVHAIEEINIVLTITENEDGNFIEVDGGL